MWVTGGTGAAIPPSQRSAARVDGPCRRWTPGLAGPRLTAQGAAVSRPRGRWAQLLAELEAAEKACARMEEAVARARQAATVGSRMEWERERYVHVLVQALADVEYRLACLRLERKPSCPGSVDPATARGAAGRGPGGRARDDSSPTG